MKRNEKVANGLMLSLCVALLVTSYVLVTYIIENWTVVEQVELQVINREFFVVATINADIVNVIFVVGFMLATLFISGCYLIASKAYPIKRYVDVQK